MSLGSTGKVERGLEFKYVSISVKIYVRLYKLLRHYVNILFKWKTLYYLS